MSDIPCTRPRPWHAHWRWGMVGAWMVFILAFTLSAPGSLSPGLRFLIALFGAVGLPPITVEYAFHFAAHFVLAILLAGAVAEAYLARLSLRRLLLVLGLVALFGALQEGLQGLVPGRHPGFDDLAANVAGGLVAAIGLACFTRDTCLQMPPAMDCDRQPAELGQELLG